MFFRLTLAVKYDVGGTRIRTMEGSIIWFQARQILFYSTTLLNTIEPPKVHHDQEHCIFFYITNIILIYERRPQLNSYSQILRLIGS